MLDLPERGAPLTITIWPGAVTWDINLSSPRFHERSANSPIEIPYQAWELVWGSATQPP
jgi:hypothetical protein